MAVLAAGTLLGVLSALLATVGGSVGHGVHLVLDAGWAWAALAFCVGLVQNRKLESAALATTYLLTAVIAYYVTKLGQGAFLAADVSDPSGRTIQVDWYSFWSRTLFWCIVACVAGAFFGLAGNLARKRGLLGHLFRVLVPLVAIVDTSERLGFDPSPGGLDTTIWTVIRLLAVAAVVVLAGHLVTTRWFRRSARVTG